MVHGHHRARIIVFRITQDAITFGHDYNFLARDLVLLKRLPDDPLGLTIGVDIGSVPLSGGY